MSRVKHQVQYRQAKNAKRRRWFNPRLLPFLVPILIVGTIYPLLYYRYFRVQHVKMTGVWQHLNRQALSTVVEPYVHTALWHVDIYQLQHLLQESPWVASAHIQRVWPGTLVIHLTEKTPFAKWRERGLFTPYGKLFRPLDLLTAQHLPLLWGPEGSATLVWQRYKQMARLLTPLHLEINKIELNNREAWKLRLNNGTLIQLGRDKILARLQRLVLIYPKIMKHRNTDVNVIDLRYTNGLSIR